MSDSDILNPTSCLTTRLWPPGGPQANTEIAPSRLSTYQMLPDWPYCTNMTESTWIWTLSLSVRFFSNHSYHHTYYSYHSYHHKYYICHSYHHSCNRYHSYHR